MAAPVPKVSLSGSPTTGDNAYGVTVTVPAGGPAPTGDVTVDDSGGSSCATPLTGGGTTWTGGCTIDAETAGRKVTATFGGDAYYASATSSQTLTVKTPVPAVSTVSPAAGPLKGGTVITVTGSGFGSRATVAIGGVRATGVHVVSAAELTATVPREAAGTYAVLVTTAGGTNPAGPTGDTFTYDPVPVVTGLSIGTEVGTSGGFPVDVYGTGFTADATVALGQGKGPVVDSVPWPVTAVTATAITATVAPSKVGAFTVYVTTPGGTSTADGSSTFTVVAAASST